MSKKKRRAVDSKSKQQAEALGFVFDKPGIQGVHRAMDGYSNPPANLGVGAQNLAQSGRYLMQRFTWDYYTLNILYRNNWIAKAIIDKPANEMLKNGFEIQSQIDPDQITKIMKTWQKTKTRDKFLECLKWARLYGGCLLIPMIANQPDLSEPLDFDTIMPDSYKGAFTIDRWSGVSPSLELVTDIDDPDFGQPEYYTISDNTQQKTYKIHHSRVVKIIGRRLPYWEEIAETYWGASELEHVFTELKKRDDTSANISFLIFLANIRVLKNKQLSQMLTLGDQEAASQVFQAMQQVNQMMCNTGMYVMDSDDDFSEHQYSFTGINDVYESFMLDISGAAEIPIDKLFGRSPSGFNSGAETLQNYYDNMQEKQESDIRTPIEKLVKIIAMSTLGELPDDMEIVFNPIRRPADIEKADLAQKQAEPIFAAYSGGLIGKGTALRELRQQSSLVGIWSNITDEMIDDAEEEDKKKKQEESEEKEELDRLASDLTGGKNETTAKNDMEETEEKSALGKDVRQAAGRNNLAG